MTPTTEPVSTKHPRGLYTLFFTEMWERFSYYGMRALLVLFMVDAVARGGLGLDGKTAAAIYGLYTAFVYLAALPGGWIADRLLGAQRAVWYGGIIIAAGNFMLVLPTPQTFFFGLLLIVLGTGLLKPNISAIVGQLYPEGGGRRDAGFTIFYVGINLGSAIGPLVCSTIGEKLSWHYGFAPAGVGMLLGLLQFKLTAKHLGTAGLLPHREGGEGSDRAAAKGWRYVGAGVAVLALVVGLIFAGVIRIDPQTLAHKTTYVIVGIAVAYFIGIFAFGKLAQTEKKQMSVIIILLVCAVVFFAGFEQAGSSLNLFAKNHTDRMLSLFNYEIPAGWFQTLNPVFIVTLAPAFAVLWVRLARRNLDPSTPLKFAFALLLLALGFLVMVFAARVVATGNKALPYWLILTYLVHTFGEICLSPVGLSAVTKLAPARFVGQMLGLWFLATSLGNLIAGLFAGELSAEAVDQMPRLFLRMVLISAAAGVVLVLLVRPIKKLMGTTR